MERQLWNRQIYFDLLECMQSINDFFLVNYNLYMAYKYKKIV